MAPDQAYDGAALSTDELVRLRDSITPGEWAAGPHPWPEQIGCCPLTGRPFSIHEVSSRRNVAAATSQTNARAIALVPDLLSDLCGLRVEVEAMGWRPIETALATDDYSPLMLLWVPHDLDYLGGYVFVGTRNVAGNWIDNLVMDEHQPTHWMPLPAAPTTGESHE